MVSSTWNCFSSAPACQEDERVRAAVTSDIEVGLERLHSDFVANARREAERAGSNWDGCPQQA